MAKRRRKLGFDIMGECGCTSGNATYKLKAPGGWYVFQMNPGCSYCDVGPSIHVSMPKATKLYYNDELEHIPILPTIGSNKEEIVVIQCGVPRNQAVDTALKIMVGTKVDNDGIIDDVLADILGEDFWKEAMTKSPKVVLPQMKGKSDVKTGGGQCSNNGFSIGGVR